MEIIEESSEDIRGFDIIHAHFILPAYFAQNQNFVTICTSHSLLSKEISYNSSSLPLYRRDEILECISDESSFYRDINNLIVLSDDHRKEIKQISGRDAKLMNPIFDNLEKVAFQRSVAFFRFDNFNSNFMFQLFIQLCLI